MTNQNFSSPHPHPNAKSVSSMTVKQPNILITLGELRLNQAEHFWSFLSGQGTTELLFLFLYHSGMLLDFSHSTLSRDCHKGILATGWFVPPLFFLRPFLLLDDSFHFNLGSTPANISLTPDQRENWDERAWNHFCRMNGNCFSLDFSLSLSLFSAVQGREHEAETHAHNTTAAPGRREEAIHHRQL